MAAGPQAPVAPADREETHVSRRPVEPAALFLLAVLAIVWSWWTAKYGAFFGTVLLPGTIVLCAATVLLAWSAPWRASLRPGRPATIALASLAALGAWATLSAVWSPAPDVAIATGQRILTYALAFGLGIWLCNLLGRRVHLALVPLAVAGAFAGVFTVVGVLTADHVGRYLETDATLEFPLGYRNANAAFFAIALWPALGLASRSVTAWPVRAAALATATLCIDLAMLSQSRASLLGGAAALAVYLLFAHDRARRLGWLVLAALPALPIIPSLVDLFHAGTGDAPLSAALDELHRAGRAVVLTTLLSLAIGTAVALLGKRVPASPRRVQIANRATAVGLVAFVIGGSITFAAVVGSPIDWIDKRVGQLSSGRDIDVSGKSSRFSSLSASTRRPAIWRVAILDGRDDPLLGEGGGGFRYSYLRQRHRDSPAAVQDAHSVELENLSQFGFPGLLLFAAAIIAAAIGALRARRLGPEPAWLSIIALTAASYWLVHSSVDWFWPYPAITAPVLALLGSACAPALRIVGDAPRGRGRLWLTAGAVVLAISAVPPYLSERYVNSAYDEWRSDPSRAYDDLDRAHSLNPLSADPLLAEGAIARANGDRDRAIDAFHQAIDIRPEEWASYYNLARLYARRSPRLAREQLAIAKEKNPLDPQIPALRHRLQARR
jgi:O-antigen ligase/polysaccharide polymerase Wzy-like membrane protein